MFNTSNPITSTKLFNKTKDTATSDGIMTIEGTTNKLSFLLFLVILSASLVWSKTLAGDLAFGTSMAIMGTIGGLICAIVTVFNINIAHITAPLYALFEGLAIGGISAFFEKQYPGIAMQAAGLTFAVLFAMLAAYKTKLIKVTEKFKTCVICATGGIMLFYLISFFLNVIFDFQFGRELSHGNNTIGIAFSVFVVGLASLNLVLDFDFIERASRSNAPKKMEWYGAFAILVTLIWLYFEILRLISKLRSRD